MLYVCIWIMHFIGYIFVGWSLESNIRFYFDPFFVLFTNVWPNNSQWKMSIKTAIWIHLGFPLNKFLISDGASYLWLLLYLAYVDDSHLGRRVSRLPKLLRIRAGARPALDDVWRSYSWKSVPESPKPLCPGEQSKITALLLNHTIQKHYIS